MLEGTVDKYCAKLGGETTNLFYVSPNNYLLYIIAYDQGNHLLSFVQKLEKSLNLTFVDPCFIAQIVKKIQRDATIYQHFYYSIFI
jgi:hypothetical protein